MSQGNRKEEEHSGQAIAGDSGWGNRHVTPGWSQASNSEREEKGRRSGGGNLCVTSPHTYNICWNTGVFLQDIVSIHTYARTKSCRPSQCWAPGQKCGGVVYIYGVVPVLPSILLHHPDGEMKHNSSNTGSSIFQMGSSSLVYTKYGTS